MATPVTQEHHVVHHDVEDSSSAGALAVVIIAALAIIGFFLYAMQVFPFNAATPSDDVNIDLPDVQVPVAPPTNQGGTTQ